MSTGDCKSDVLCAPLDHTTALKHEAGVADVVIPSDIPYDSMLEALISLSHLLLEIEGSGEPEYVAACVECSCSKQINLWMERSEVGDMLDTLKAHEITVHRSTVYIISRDIGCYPEDVRYLTEQEKQSRFDFENNFGFILVHALNKGLSSQGPTTVTIICVLAQHTTDNISSHWTHIGASVMQVLAMYNAAGPFRLIHSLRIQDYIGLERTASRHFLSGVCSQADRLSIAILAPPSASV
jgi:hypothetical protein